MPNMLGRAITLPKHDWTCSDVHGCARTGSEVFGYIRTSTHVYDRIRTCSNTSETSGYVRQCPIRPRHPWRSGTHLEVSRTRTELEVVSVSVIQCQFWTRNCPKRGDRCRVTHSRSATAGLRCRGSSRRRQPYRCLCWLPSGPTPRPGCTR